MDYGKERLVELLLAIDEEATLALGEDSERYPIVIVGGSAFLLHDLTNRPATHDVGVLSCHAALKGILANYQAVNGSVSAYIDQIPYNFEDRLVSIDLPASTVEFLTPSVEDLAIMKLYGWRPNDQQYLESMVSLGKIDWSLMDALVYGAGEAKASALSPRRYAEMVSVYELFARKHGHEPHV